MKKFLAILLYMIGATMVHAQITITAPNMPVPTADYNLMDISGSTITNPTPATSVNWDLSPYSGSGTTLSYVPETDTFFTNTGVDVNLYGNKAFNSAFGYYIYREIDFGFVTDIAQTGFHVPYQNYPLSSFTSGPSDSLVMPEQKIRNTAPVKLVHFPVSAGSSWHSVSRMATNFTLSIASYSLVNTPGQHVYYVHRDDSIVGWGKMRVYTTSGPSIWYDVLMDRIGEYAIDSFYLNGLPAPTALLSGFMVTQGQGTDSNYRYNFYRKGSFCYLASFVYGNDATYTNALNKYVNTDSIIPANVGVQQTEISYTTVLFPNPSKGSEVNIMISGGNKIPASYLVTDVTGKVVETGKIASTTGMVRIAFDRQLLNGNYFVTVFDPENNKIATEQFEVSK